MAHFLKKYLDTLAMATMSSAGKLIHRRNVVSRTVWSFLAKVLVTNSLTKVAQMCDDFLGYFENSSKSYWDLLFR